MVKIFILYIIILCSAMIYVVETEKQKDSEKDLKKELKNEIKRSRENF